MKVNKAEIKNIPFIVIVYMPPKLLLQPVVTISKLKRPGSLIYSQTEDMILTTIVNENRVMKVDMQLHSIPILSDFITLPYISEITQDMDQNIFTLPLVKMNSTN